MTDALKIERPGKGGILSGSWRSWEVEEKFDGLYVTGDFFSVMSSSVSFVSLPGPAGTADPKIRYAARLSTPAFRSRSASCLRA
jgi:hypothetical protein